MMSGNDKNLINYSTTTAPKVKVKHICMAYRALHDLPVSASTPLFPSFVLWSACCPLTPLKFSKTFGFMLSQDFDVLYLLPKPPSIVNFYLPLLQLCIRQHLLTITVLSVLAKSVSISVLQPQNCKDTGKGDGCYYSFSPSTPIITLSTW